MADLVTSPDDMVARLGGNEFAVLLRGADSPRGAGGGPSRS